MRVWFLLKTRSVVYGGVVVVVVVVENGEWKCSVLYCEMPKVVPADGCFTVDKSNNTQAK